MDFSVSNVVAEGEGIALLRTNSTSASKTFNNNDSDREITLDIVVGEDEDNVVTVTYSATVLIELVDLDGEVHNGFPSLAMLSPQNQIPRIGLLSKA